MSKTIFSLLESLYPSGNFHSFIRDSLIFQFDIRLHLSNISFCLIKVNLISSSLFLKSALWCSMVSSVSIRYATCWSNSSLDLINSRSFSKKASFYFQVIYNLLHIMTEFELLDPLDWWFQFIVVAGSFSYQYQCNVSFCSGHRHNL